jgi:tRNA-dihydrouridine synthase A
MSSDSELAGADIAPSQSRSTLKKSTPKALSHCFSVAPMLDWTDRHCRYFHRLLTQHALLYTEMVTTGALLHGDQARHLDFDESEHPLALQLGGSDPGELARCARIGERWGYDEINLNVGCPSDRVQSGRFGACLMLEPGLVADGVKAMRDAVSVPVTVKHRIGVDERDSYAELVDFVGTLAEAGCRCFIVHARKAWLQGLSPKENREVPPLHYDWVHGLKRDFPALEIVLNGGIQDLVQAREQLAHCDGVMLGRAAYQDPWLLAGVGSQLYGAAPSVDSRGEVVRRLIPYAQQHLAGGGRLHQISRHLLGLYNGQPGARRWRRMLSEDGCREGVGPELWERALAVVDRAREGVERFSPQESN